MDINGSGIVILAMFLAMSGNHGVPKEKVRATL
jgi:methylmalonyl-CoA mutase N-terminal domain/subunit